MKTRHESELVRLIFSKDVEQPVLNKGGSNSGGLITMPVRNNMEILHFEGGKKFVILYPAKSFGAIRASAFFGGRDQKTPFIVGIDETAARKAQRGEAQFQDALKPVAIKMLECIFPKAQVNRQGDIWSIPLPVQAENIIATWKPNSRLHREYNFDEFRTLHILGTSHSLDGKYLPIGSITVCGKRFHNVALGQGILSADDHRTLFLDKSLHLFARTPHLLQGCVRKEG